MYVPQRNAGRMQNDEHVRTLVFAVCYKFLTFVLTANAPRFSAVCNAKIVQKGGIANFSGKNKGFRVVRGFKVVKGLKVLRVLRVLRVCCRLNGGSNKKRRRVTRPCNLRDLKAAGVMPAARP